MVLFPANVLPNTPARAGALIDRAPPSSLAWFSTNRLPSMNSVVVAVRKIPPPSWSAVLPNTRLLRKTSEAAPLAATAPPTVALLVSKTLSVIVTEAPCWTCTPPPLAPPSFPENVQPSISTTDP